MLLRSTFFLSSLITKNRNQSMKKIFSAGVRYTSSVVTRNSAMSRETVPNKPIESAIREKLNSNLKPVHLKVINESHMHNVPKDSETHFKIIVVSDKFENIPLLHRHRMVNELLQHELKHGVHALSLVTRTPNQWSEDEEVEPSPKCLGGEK